MKTKFQTTTKIKLQLQKKSIANLTLNEQSMIAAGAYITFPTQSARVQYGDNPCTTKSNPPIDLNQSL